MNEFFHNWRRTLGCVSALMAFVSAAGCMTILFADEAIEPVPDEQELIKRIFAIHGDAATAGGHIITVSLRDATDENFALLKDLKYVRCLDCAYCKTDGSGLEHIAQMKRLERLWLHDNNLKNEHLKYISDFPCLNELYLENTPTNNNGLRRIRSLKSLRKLYLANTRITDKGLKHLQGLTDLEELDLRDTKVTPQGIADLKKHLSKTNIYANAEPTNTN